jgi:cobalt/nickel transport system ATP-binding protein
MVSGFTVLWNNALGHGKDITVMDSDFLNIENVSYRYEADREVLRHISFTVRKGSCVCIAGANGSGKSTLLELIGGCMKPGSGDILVGGVSSIKSPKENKRTGIIFQEPDNQLFMPTVWEDVAFGIMKDGVSPEEGRAQAYETLKMVGAEHLADRPPYKLSGGEKQRVAIASVLIMKREILLLDEPTASLDPRARKGIIRLLQNLDATKIIASHDLDMALNICDEVIFLHEGILAARSPTPGLLTDECFLQSIGLELPLSIAARGDLGACRTCGFLRQN